MFASSLNALQAGESLDQEQVRFCFNRMMEGVLSDTEIADFLTALKNKGETATEIATAAMVLREHAERFDAPEGAIDCCGTGGDSSNSFNISTAVAFVVAGAGVPVAKHGNRSVSSASGSADVLEHLGVNITAPKEVMEGALRDIGIAFIMAPLYHSAMKYVAPVRKKLGVRTIFNILGPLANPARTQYQLVGVYDKSLVSVMAKSLKKLGTNSAWVVSGEDGMDEITTTASTHVAILRNGEIKEITLHPRDAGFALAKTQQLVGGTPVENAASLRQLLQQEGSDAYRDIVLFNAAACLVLRGQAADIVSAVPVAAHSIDSGAALAKLDALKEYTK